LKPKPTAEAMKKASTSLDSLATLIRKGKVTFEMAALHYSADKNSRNGGGVAINPYTMSSKWKKEELDPDVGKILDGMKENEISDPFATIDDSQRLVYKIVRLLNRTKAHRANLQEDYQFLHDMYLQEKQEEEINKWVSKQQARTYIHVDETYVNCNFKFKGWKK